jgi:hypothetical protein
MPVNVNEIESDVIPEPEPPASGGGHEPDWKTVSKMREMYGRLRRDMWRTTAEGFDD